MTTCKFMLYIVCCFTKYSEGGAKLCGIFTNLDDAKKRLLLLVPNHVPYINNCVADGDVVAWINQMNENEYLYRSLSVTVGQPYNAVNLYADDLSMDMDKLSLNN